MTAGNNPREFVRILKILYKANGLPTFNIPEEVFNAPGSTLTTDPVEDADSTSDDDDSATAMQTSDPVLVPTAHKTLPHVTPTSATVPVTNHDITVNAATLSDLLSAPAPHVSPAVADPSPVSVANFAAIDPWCDPIEGTYYSVPSAAVPTTATQPSRTQPSRTQPSRTLPQRVNTPALHSSDESDEDVSVGTPSPPRKDHPQAATRNVTTKTDKPKKKTNDQSLVKSTRKKTTNELT
nr:flocculation protein FLO11-like [Procambarus clarkii]